MSSVQTLPVLLATSNILSSIDSISILSTLKFIKDVIIFGIEIVAGFLVLIFVSRFLSFLSNKNEEAVILPFEVSTSNKMYNGKILSDSLVVELRKIKKIHEHQFEEESIICEKIYLPKLSPDKENFETAISNIGNITIAGINLSVGGILVVLKQLWPFGGQAKTIKGSLQEYGSETRLITVVEGPSVHGWDTSFEINQSTNEDKILESIKDLAFMITYDLSTEEAKKKEEIKKKERVNAKALMIAYDFSNEEVKKKEGIQAKTWISLKYFTEALDFYSKYTTTKKTEYLENAKNSCIKALDEEKDYQILFNLFYCLGVSYFNITNYDSAEVAFRHCIDLTPNNENGFIGLGIVLGSNKSQKHDEALEAFEKALEIKPKCAEAWYNKGVALGNLNQYKEALEAYDKALEIEPNADAWYNKACAYSQINKKDEALENLKNAVKFDPSYKKSAKSDTDFKNLWGDKDFKKIVSAKKVD